MVLYFTVDLMYLAFIEYKNESGHGGDALIQPSRAYQMYTCRQKNLLRVAVQCS